MISVFRLNMQNIRLVAGAELGVSRERGTFRNKN